MSQQARYTINIHLVTGNTAASDPKIIIHRGRSRANRWNVQQSTSQAFTRCFKSSNSFFGKICFRKRCLHNRFFAHNTYIGSALYKTTRQQVSTTFYNNFVNTILTQFLVSIFSSICTHNKPYAKNC